MVQAGPVEPSLRTYFRIIGRRVHWLLAATILAVGVSAALSATEKKQYTAVAQLLVQPVTGVVPVSGTQQSISSTDVLTELQLINSAAENAQVSKRLGFVPSASASELGQTNVISLSATAATPALAARVANTYAKSFVSSQQASALNSITTAEQQVQSEINSVQTQLAPLERQTAPSSALVSEISALEGQQAVLKEQQAQLQLTAAETPGGIEVVSPAIPPTSPSAPKPIKSGLIALVIGLALGLGLCFAIEYFDDKVYTKDEVERLTDGVPVLAMIPKVTAWKRANRPMLIADVDPFSPVAEAYRSLRTSLQFAAHDGELKTLLITSASGSEGKTSTVANLSVVLAKAGERTVVVGCDLRRPRIGSFLGRGETPGFTNVILNQRGPEAGIKQALQSVGADQSLALLATGPIPPNPAELLGSQQAAEIFRLLAKGFDTVVIDSPPLLPVSDAQVLASYADAILLVVSVGQTTRGELERACELLSQVNARPAGIVLNKVTRRSGDAGEYAYSYGHKYRYTPSRQDMTATQGQGLRPAHVEHRRESIPKRSA